MACKCAYAKSFFSRGDKGYSCRNEYKKKDSGSDLCCGTHFYSTGHARPDIAHNYDEMYSCGYRKTELTEEEKAKFSEEDKKERRTLNKIEKSLINLSKEDMIRMKYSDY